MSRNKAEVDKIRAEMKRAVRYRSGPDLMNEVYLGGMATAGMMHLMGTSATRASRDGKSLDDVIDDASDGQIEEAYDYKGYQWILNHYIQAGRKLYKFTTTREEIA